MNKEQLRAAINIIPPAGVKPPRFSWDERRNSLRREILKGNPEKFMEWAVVCEFLHTGMVPHVQDELDHLMLHPDWPRWENAINVPAFGGSGRNIFHATGTSIQQAYYLSVWEDNTGDEVGNLDTIFEFGGGYGAMALACAELGFGGEYSIFDLPEVSLLQQYYLSNVGVDNVEFNSGTLDPDLFIATFSISEVAFSERVIPYADSYLIGYQPQWGNLDNSAYFSDFCNTRSEYTWRDMENPYFTNHRILIGYY